MMVPAVASAAHPLRSIQPDGSAQRFQFVGARGANGLTYVRQVVPASGSGVVPGTTAATQVAQSRVLYLNHNALTLVPGNNDSKTGTSSIVTEPVDMSGWGTDDGTWADTLACVQDMYSRFAVTVTDQDPGDVPHIMAVVGGSPLDVGLPDNVAGVSPFTEDCGIIENSIVFTFADVLPNDAQTVCEVMSQELAHSFGLDHEMEADDPMTYLDYNGDREFQDLDVSCGEYADRPCGINGSICRPSQNSVQLLGQRVGMSNGTNNPMFGITSPSNGDKVSQGFTVDVSAIAGIQLTTATLFIDNKQVATATPSGQDFTLTAPGSLADGTHHLKVTAGDGTHTSDQTIDVTVGDSGGMMGLGCSAGGRSGFGALALVLAALLRRRR
jgi:hypothetical protein